MTNINSQHHNLLGNQISSKSEDLCIWWPFLYLNYITGNETILLFCYDDDNRINVKKNPEMMNKSDNKKIF